jgi:hypothetical protein
MTPCKWLLREPGAQWFSPLERWNLSSGWHLEKQPAGDITPTGRRARERGAERVLPSATRWLFLHGPSAGATCQAFGAPSLLPASKPAAIWIC